ncbi:MAG: hypothetical protein AB7I41_08575 [Candidatus Sericytochromatia bacterium]
MLDFASLTQARQGLNASETIRHQESQTCYEQGRQCVREGIRPPVNKAKLKEASQHFAKGMALNYKNAANYFGMGFLFLLIAEPKQALPVIKAGLEHAPDSVLGQVLFEQAQNTLLPKAAAPVERPLLPQIESASEDLDFDELYDQTEAALLLFMKLILSDEVLGLKPTPNGKQLRALQAKLTDFEAKTCAFEDRLKIIDQEIEVQDLQVHLGQIHKVLTRLKTLSTQFEAFLDIQAEIDKHRELTEQIMSETESTADPADIPVLEENLQTLLDHCDGIADRLDELETQRVDISPLNPPYTHYAEQLERFQDLLEETLDRLKTA